MTAHRRSPAAFGSTASPSAAPPQPLVIDVATVLIEFQSSGRLMPWLGPAIRGVVAGRLRERHCVLPLAEQAGRWRRCTGCPHLPDCGYGRIFEPDEQVLPRGIRDARGLQDVPRRVVLAPAFPAPVRAQPGLRLPISIVCIGEHARAALGEVEHVLAEAGQAGVLGTDRLRFAIAGRGDAPMRIRLDAAALPDGSAGENAVVRRLRVVLTSPLFLRARDPSRRPIPCRSPSLHQLVRASVDTVAALSLSHGAPLPSDTRRLVALARDVSTHAADWRLFDQEKHSNRSRSRFEVRGVVGEAIFADVPRSVVPWLALAGQLHVGGHRVAGAGGWRVEELR